MPQLKRALNLPLLTLYGLGTTIVPASTPWWGISPVSAEPGFVRREQAALLL